MELFSTKEEYEKIINSKTYKKFEMFCIGIKNMNIVHFVFHHLNPFFSDSFKYLEKRKFKDLFKSLEWNDYIHRGKIFKNINKDQTCNREKNIKNYINYCKRLNFKKEYEKVVTYFITDGEYVKIGQSIKPKERLSVIQTYNPKDLTLLHVFEDIVESKAHEIFSDKKMIREWFIFDLETIIRIESLKKKILFP